MKALKILPLYAFCIGTLLGSIEASAENGLCSEVFEQTSLSSAEAEAYFQQAKASDSAFDIDLELIKDAIATSNKKSREDIAAYVESELGNYTRPESGKLYEAFRERFSVSTQFKYWKYIVKLKDGTERTGYILALSDSNGRPAIRFQTPADGPQKYSFWDRRNWQFLTHSFEDIDSISQLSP